MSRPHNMHVYEGSDSDSDEYVTSGRAFRDVKEKEILSRRSTPQVNATKEPIRSRGVNHESSKLGH